jgi:rare lipoprotein A
MMENFRKLLVTGLILLLTGCTATPPAKRPMMDGPLNYDVDVNDIPDATPKAEPRSKYGNPANYRVNGRSYHTLTSSKNFRERGIASWYGTKFHGQYTSSREPYNMLAMTAAHRTLPLPTYVKVTNLQNGRQVIVKVNDRGPFAANRIIDLSYAAAKKLGITQRGTGLVEVAAIDPIKAETTSQYVAKEISQANPEHPILYMQIGSFAKQNNAKQLADRVRKLTTKPVRIKTINHTGNPIYQVQIGPLINVAESDSLHGKLSTEKLGNPLTLVE